MSTMRTETDSLGEVEVLEDRYWGAQTQRSLQHFAIDLNHFRWPRVVVKALGLVKKASAHVNLELGLLEKELAAGIIAASDEVIEGKLDDHFPLGVFQTGSGTHSNMNANEVIANRAIELMGGKLGSKEPVHPNDHVNLCQSSNDVFPTVMHLVIIELLQDKLKPALTKLITTFATKSKKYETLVKTGRTHLQDAAPITLGQEISAWLKQLIFVLDCLKASERELYSLAIGGTAVGTGLNSKPEFGEQVAQQLERYTGIPFYSADNKFFALASHEPLLNVSAQLRSLSTALIKISNDIRLLASGPRCGIGELNLPANEPGSSIMPGKVNPTQCEALTMVCSQVLGNDATICFANSQGNFQLNVYKPVILHNLIESIVILADAIISFEQYCIAGLSANETNIAANLEKNLMLVTVLNQYIGYDRAVEIGKLATTKNLTLREAAIESGYLDGAQFDQWVQPLNMT